MLTYIINHIALAFVNVVNSRLDAYRILRHKNIAHGINLGAYALVVAFLIWRQQPAGWPEIIDQVNFGLSAFFNRQLSFDIPLNLRRGLEWDYQSTAEKPKAVMDQIERWLFGKLEGKYIAGIYAVGFIICTLKKIVFE